MKPLFIINSGSAHGTPDYVFFEKSLFATFEVQTISNKPFKVRQPGLPDLKYNSGDLVTLHNNESLVAVYGKISCFELFQNTDYYIYFNSVSCSTINTVDISYCTMQQNVLIGNSVADLYMEYCNILDNASLAVEFANNLPPAKEGTSPVIYYSTNLSQVENIRATVEGKGWMLVENN